MGTSANTSVTAADLQVSLRRLRSEAEAQLVSILDYWIMRCTDKQYGGYYGRVYNDNTVETTAEKGSVLHARILWTFSAACNCYSPSPAYTAVARRAYRYLVKTFIDGEYGGVYWTVDYRGRPRQTKKQVYAQAFAIYAFSEYYKFTGEAVAKNAAIDLFRLLEKWSYDNVHGGYLEAFTRDWKLADDLRLSDKDANEKKTMNTHLHVLEGYANLYSIWPDELLAQRIRELLAIFSTKIIDNTNGHLRLFFNDSWEVKGNIFSYGHDIEASWLLLEAAEVIGDNEWIQICRRTGPLMADAAAEAIDRDGGMWYELDAAVGELVKEKHWWVQAEALIGFFSGWEIRGNKKYLDTVFNSWDFINKYLIDEKNGEWFWGVREDHAVMDEDKAGLWKCPYHNGRACLQLIQRIDKVLSR